MREKVDNEKWLAAYLKEIDFYSDYLKEKDIQTIYFGGGTPSLMKPEMVAEIISKIKKDFKVKDNAEITLEANPASSEIEKFRAFKQAGVNRLSIGIQSFDEERLKFLGRKHNRIEAIKAIEAARQIFDNYTFDLIYATKGQTEESWRSELDFALKFNAPHISLYQLTIEKGTDFYGQDKKGEIKTTNDGLSENLYFQTVERLAENGLERYEISNFARLGFESQHNMNYWNYGEYLGIGAGAHSRINIDRHCEEQSDAAIHPNEPDSKSDGLLRHFIPRNDDNTRISIFDIHSPENWLEAVMTKGNGIQKKLELSKQQMLEEMLYMGLRIRDGIELSNFNRILGKGFFEIFDKKKTDFLISEGMLEVSSRLKATEKSIMLHSSLVKKLIKIAREV